MLTIISAIIFTFIIVLNVLLIFGLPLGELTMGGQYKVLPKKLKVLALFSLFVQIFALLIILQTGGFLPYWFSIQATKIICFIFAIYLSMNTLMNIFSKSKKEKFIMTPLSLILSVNFWITAFQI